jgi:DNA-binding IclR family transcriptional regulator
MITVARDPGIRLRDIAAQVGITERAAHRVVSELVAEGYLTRERDGRRNRYAIGTNGALNHSLVGDAKVSDLLRVFVPPTDQEPAPALDKR